MIEDFENQVFDFVKWTTVCTLAVMWNGPAVQLAVLYLVGYAYLMVHEIAGHYYVACKVGIPVSSVRIGTGGNAFEFMYRQVRFTFNVNPLSSGGKEPLGECSAVYWPVKPWKLNAFSLAGNAADFVMLYIAAFAGAPKLVFLWLLYQTAINANPWSKTGDLGAVIHGHVITRGRRR